MVMKTNWNPTGMNQNLKIGQGFGAPGFFGAGTPGEPPHPHPAGMWGGVVPP